MCGADTGLPDTFPIIWSKFRELNLYLRYQRTQSTMISRSKYRPLNKSNAFILDHYRRPFQSPQSLHQNPVLRNLQAARCSVYLLSRSSIPVRLAAHITAPCLPAGPVVSSVSRNRNQESSCPADLRLSVEASRRAQEQHSSL
jgi:hypothetical protein